MLFGACALNNSSNIKIQDSSTDLIIVGKSTALDVEKILGPKYLYSYGYRPRNPEFNGKMCMIYDAGSRFENSGLPFVGPKLVQKTFIVVLDKSNVVAEKQMLSEPGFDPAYQ